MRSYAVTNTMSQVQATRHDVVISAILAESAVVVAGFPRGGRPEEPRFG